MLDNLKIKLIQKWTLMFVRDIKESLFVYEDEQREYLEDIANDLEICEKVYSKYSALIND